MSFRASPTASSFDRNFTSDLIFLAVFGLFFCLWNLGAGSLASWDEAMYAQVAREITRGGDWINLRFLDEDWYVKPPLGFWATAVFIKVFGDAEFAARLFSALCGVGAVLATYAGARRFFGREEALFAAGALLSSTDYLHFSRWGMLDVPNLFFFAVALFTLIRARDNSAWLWIFWMACAAAFMTKGPVILLAPVVAVVFLVWERDFGVLKAPAFWVGALAAVLWVLPWHAAAYLHNPEMFLRDFIGTHWLSRSGSAIDGHAQSWYFYVRTLINKFHPWVALLPAALAVTAWKAVRGDRAARFATVWVWTVLLFFTFVVKTKLRWYILPCYPALTLCCGILVAPVFRGRTVWIKAAVALTLVLHFPFSKVMLLDYSSGLKALAPVYARESGGDPGPVYLYRFHESPAVAYYFGRNSRYVESATELESVLREIPRLLLVLKKQVYDADRAFFEAQGLGVLHATSGLRDDVVLLGTQKTVR